MVFLVKESWVKDTHFELVIESDLSKLSKVERFTEKLANKMNFSEADKDSLAISITEIVNNAISHGNKNDKQKKVYINYDLSPKGMTITVQDEGKGFNLDEVDNPLEPENLLKESGRGIYIVRALVDKVEFEKNNIGTLVRMVKNIKKNIKKLS